MRWRCFHCDFATQDPGEAKAHFGETSDEVPLCKWSEGDLRAELQQTMLQLEHEREENHQLRSKIERLTTPPEAEG
jgi:hypothetical protein